MMHVDPDRLGYQQYAMVLREWNWRHDPDNAGKQQPDFTRLKRAMDAQTVH